MIARSADAEGGRPKSSTRHRTLSRLAIWLRVICTKTDGATPSVRQAASCIFASCGTRNASASLERLLTTAGDHGLTGKDLGEALVWLRRQGFVLIDGDWVTPVGGGLR